MLSFSLRPISSFRKVGVFFSRFRPYMKFIIQSMTLYFGLSRMWLSKCTWACKKIQLNVLTIFLFKFISEESNCHMCTFYRITSIVCKLFKLSTNVLTVPPIFILQTCAPCKFYTLIVAWDETVFLVDDLSNLVLVHTPTNDKSTNSFVYVWSSRLRVNMLTTFLQYVLPINHTLKGSPLFGLAWWAL